MAFDYSKLRGRITEKFGKQSAFADAVGISSVALSRKLMGKTAISVDDIRHWSSSNLLDIAPSEYHTYFFAEKVHKM
jgi:transcriptional regulator with XRE-family HTH domain